MTGRPVTNIAQALEDTAAGHKDRTAIIEAASGRSCTFGELTGYVRSYRSYLQRQGVVPGDRVVLMVKPSIDFIALTFALFRIGATIILIDPGMGYKNLLSCIEKVRPVYVIGIPAVVVLSYLFRRKFNHVKKRFCCGSFFGIPFADIRKRIRPEPGEFAPFEPDARSLAAIIFTTGSTGPPKGVRFEHSIFAAQLEKIKSYYMIGPGDIDQPGFPLFALFSTALGACAVIPDMDPTKPARVNPEKFVKSLIEYGVTYSFGSPAIWNAVSRYCLEKDIQCPRLKKVLMAGAPVSGRLIEDVYEMIAEDGEIHTPYGATESLPIVSIEGREITGSTWPLTIQGRGTCVGRPLPGISVKVIESVDGAITVMTEVVELPEFEIGEIIVKGDVVTHGYDSSDEHDRLSKIQDSSDFWHRMGDVGYFDGAGRLWFCGRKAHRVVLRDGVMYTVCCEAITNNHPGVFRSALVGVPGGDGYQRPVMVVELNPDAVTDREIICSELTQLCREHELTARIETILVHHSFPVDIRHNAKIFREKLAVWAERQLAGTRWKRCW
jgi:acyl-CoA synthetase (AMP-forming)/AMP-acid ligase II